MKISIQEVENQNFITCDKLQPGQLAQIINPRGNYDQLYVMGILYGMIGLMEETGTWSWRESHSNGPMPNFKLRLLPPEEKITLSNNE